MKRLLIFLLLCTIALMTPVMAENVSGLYSDFDRDGEGIAVLHRDDQWGNQIAFAFFTQADRCKVTRFDDEGDLLDTLQLFTYTTLVLVEGEEGEEDTLEEVTHRLIDEVEGLSSYNHCRKIQTWYITELRTLSGDGAFGDLYITQPHDTTPNHIADVESVGIFVLDQTDAGFDLQILRGNDELHQEAELYDRDYTFEYLFGPHRQNPNTPPVPEDP